MNLKKLFRVIPKQEKPYEYEAILHIWEDDYLMIELLPFENLDFIKSETERISRFGNNNFDGVGFSDITIINKKPIKTLDKQIPIKQVKEVFVTSKLQKIESVVIQHRGFQEGGKAPLGFGTNKFAIILETNADFLEHIWITGHTTSELDRQNLKEALIAFGSQFNFLGVNWFRSEYYDLKNVQQIEEYIKSSC